MHTSLLMQPHRDRLLYFTGSSCYQTVEGKGIPLFDEKSTGAENLPHGGVTDSWPLFAFTVFELVSPMKSYSFWNNNTLLLLPFLVSNSWFRVHRFATFFAISNPEKFNHIDGTKCFKIYKMNVFSDHSVGSINTKTCFNRMLPSNVHTI